LIRIMIADDHAIMRGGLKQIVATTSDIEVVAEAMNGQEILGQLKNIAVDLLLLDLEMPAMGGIDVINALRLQWPTLPILVLSMHNGALIVTRALKAGATGYITKGSEPEILIAGIRLVARGERFIDPALVELMIFNRENGDTRSLSERERQVLTRIAAGQSLGEIAECLHLSPKTVSTHKMRLMEKLSIDNNADLLRYAISHGFGSV